jgi:hypothetical protein
MYGGMSSSHFLGFGGVPRTLARMTQADDSMNTPSQVARQKEAADHTRKTQRTLESQGEGQSLSAPKRNTDGSQSNDPAARLRELLGIDSADSGPTTGYEVNQEGGALTRGRRTAAAQAYSTRSGQIPLQRREALKSMSLKDKRHNLQSRQNEAVRRLNDGGERAGKAGTNLCRWTGTAKAEQQTGKRPWFYTDKNVGRSGVALCKPGVEEVFQSKEFLKEQELACGKTKEWVYPYQRGKHKVKGHCRELAGGPTSQKREVVASADYPDDYPEFAAFIHSQNTKPAKPPSRSRTQIAKGAKLSADAKAQLKKYGDSLPRGERATKVNRARMYVMLGRSVAEAIKLAEQRDKLGATAPKRSKAPRSSGRRFIDDEAGADDNEGEGSIAPETAADRAFINDDAEE